MSNIIISMLKHASNGFSYENKSPMKHLRSDLHKYIEDVTSYRSADQFLTVFPGDFQYLYYSLSQEEDFVVLIYRRWWVIMQSTIVMKLFVNENYQMKCKM